MPIPRRTNSSSSRFHMHPGPGPQPVVVSSHVVVTDPVQPPGPAPRSQATVQAPSVALQASPHRLSKVMPLPEIPPLRPPSIPSTPKTRSFDSDSASYRAPHPHRSVRAMARRRTSSVRSMTPPRPPSFVVPSPPRRKSTDYSSPQLGVGQASPRLVSSPIPQPVPEPDRQLQRPSPRRDSDNDSYTTPSPQHLAMPLPIQVYEPISPPIAPHTRPRSSE